MDEATIADLQMLQGSWLQVRFEENGVANPEDSHSAPGAFLTIEGGSFHVGVPEKETILKGTFTLDATTFPKSMTWVDSIGEDVGKPLPAIYDLSNDTFTFVAADEGMPRPTEFNTKPGLTLRSLVRS
jgi:uncharacterized protein (TIGR03067 family)